MAHGHVEAAATAAAALQSSSAAMCAVLPTPHHSTVVGEQWHCGAPACSGKAQSGVFDGAAFMLDGLPAWTAH
jgi:hypothetical protein